MRSESKRAKTRSSESASLLNRVIPGWDFR